MPAEQRAARLLFDTPHILLGRDELTTSQGLRCGQAQNVAQPIGEGAPKRSGGGLLIRV